MYKYAATFIVVCVGVVGVTYPSGADSAGTVTVAQVAVPSVNSKCPKIYNVQDYRSYASRVYRRKVVSQRAQNRMLRIIRCQRRASGPKSIERYHRKYKQEREARRIASLVFPVRPHLRTIAQCESHGNPKAISSTGKYRGKYQFSLETWRSVGGKGDPIDASEYEQDMRAEMLYRRSGPGQWPVCQG